MKKTIIALAIFAGATFTMNAQQALVAQFKSPSDSIGYSVGYSIGKNMKQSGLSGEDMNLINLYLGLQAGIKGDNGLLSEADIEASMAKFQTIAQAKQKVIQEKQKAIDEKEAVANKAEGEKFLAENKKQAGVTTTASGLQYKIISKGSGNISPKATDKVKVHYTGKLLNGKVFDSSVERGEPITFPLNGVIKGWTEGVQLMHVGDKFQFFIPSDLAYGDRGAGKDIAPGSTLIFDVELLEINPVEAKADQK